MIFRALCIILALLTCIKQAISNIATLKKFEYINADQDAKPVIHAW